MNKCPCFNCEQRNYPCFVYCEIYKDWRGELEKLKRQDVVAEYYKENYNRKRRKRR